MWTEASGRIRGRRIAGRRRIAFLAVHQEIDHCHDQNQRQQHAEQTAKRQASQAPETSPSSQTHDFGSILSSGASVWSGRPASDGRSIYVPVSDVELEMRKGGGFAANPKAGGGLFALDAATGRKIGQTPAPPRHTDRPCSLRNRRGSRRFPASCSAFRGRPRPGGSGRRCLRQLRLWRMGWDPRQRLLAFSVK